MDSKYKGTTVIERLYLSGLIDKFYKAAEEKDVATVKAILIQVELVDDESINAILKQLGLMK